MKRALTLVLFASLLALVSCGGKQAASAAAMTGNDHQAMMQAATPSTNAVAIATCPVSGDKFTPGKGISFTNAGYAFEVCCAACIDPIKQDMAKYGKFGKKL